MRYQTHELKDRALELLEYHARQPPLRVRLMRRAMALAGVIITVSLVAYQVGLYLGTH